MKQRSSTNRMSSRQINLHSPNPFPDIISNKHHIDHMKSSTSFPCYHKSCTIMCTHNVRQKQGTTPGRGRQL